MIMLKQVVIKFNDPSFLRSFHKWATILWFVTSIPLALILKDSITFIVWLSLYAVVVSHWSSWQAVRIEDQQQDSLDDLAEKEC